MKSWTPPTTEMIDKVFTSVREADRKYFFSKLKNPLWIEPLKNRGYFKYPPDASKLPDGREIHPYWPELSYLVAVSKEAPDQVIEIVLTIPKTNNPRIYEEIVSIILEIEGSKSGSLLSKLLEYLELNGFFLGNRFKEVLNHFERNDLIDEGIQLSIKLISFIKDPKEKDKTQLRKEDPTSWRTSLEPRPRFDSWEYKEILENGVRPLAEKAPFPVSRILIDAAANMIRLSHHVDESESIRGNDYSDIWSPRLGLEDPDDQDSRNVLAQTLTYACERVYSHTPESVEALDQALRVPRWRVFQRLRQHLYAANPTEQTLPWIREEIFAHPDYSKWDYRFEFQQMVRRACEHFGNDLLSQDELNSITDTILSGPSKEDYQTLMSDRYTDEAWESRRRYFHYKQLHPFASLLRGEVKTYYEQLAADKENNSLSDESYSLHHKSRAGTVKHVSPKSTEELSALPDDALLEFINTWDEQRRDSEDWFVEINIHALSLAFQGTFKEQILPNHERLSFWLDQRDRIERPIYVSSMLKAMQDEVKAKRFDKLDCWFEFCAWALTHEDPVDDSADLRDDSKTHPHWLNARRAVVDFIDVCLEKETVLPPSFRDSLAQLLETICTQFDGRLDLGQTLFVNGSDPVTEGINRTRSRGIQAVFHFGRWIRRTQEDESIPEVFKILEARLAFGKERHLTRPEYAILGMHLSDICLWDSDWVKRHLEILFPQETPDIWWSTFEGYILWNHPYVKVYEVLSPHFPFALANLSVPMDRDKNGDEIVENFGRHLYSYYLWEYYPLTGENSLLQEFYNQTSADHIYWSRLFNNVGLGYSNSEKDLAENLIERGKAYVSWRLEIADPEELKEFRAWLEADCFPAVWRLETYSKILDIRGGKHKRMHLEIRALRKMLPENLHLIVECFMKITQALTEDSQMYISDKDAKPIVAAGLDSPDPEIRRHAEEARENLLRLGRFDFLE